MIADWFAFDIETVPKDLDKDYGDEMPTAAESWPVSLAGVLLSHCPGTQRSSLDTVWWAGGDIAEKFFEFWRAKGQPTLYTWNGRGWDLPVLELAALASGAPGVLKGWLSWPGERKSWEDSRNRFAGFHVDLMDVMANAGATRKLSQDAVCNALGIPGKLGTDGSMVAEMFRRGEIESICGYNVQDALSLAALVARFKVAKGEDGWQASHVDAMCRDAAASFAQSDIPEISFRCTQWLEAWGDSEAT